MGQFVYCKAAGNCHEALVLLVKLPYYFEGFMNFFYTAHFALVFMYRYENLLTTFA